MSSSVKAVQLEVPQNLNDEVLVRRFLAELISIIIEQEKRITELEGA